MKCNYQCILIIVLRCRKRRMLNSRTNQCCFYLQIFDNNTINPWAKSRMNELNDAEIRTSPAFSNSASPSSSSNIPSCSPAQISPSYSQTLISSPPSRMPIMPKYSPSYPPTSRNCDPNSARSPSCNNEMDVNENEVTAANKSLVCIAIVFSRWWINFICCCFRLK